MTFDLIPIPDAPKLSVTRLRQPNDERARYVAGQKEARAEYTRLIALSGFR